MCHRHVAVLSIRIHQMIRDTTFLPITSLPRKMNPWYCLSQICKEVGLAQSFCLLLCKGRIALERNGSSHGLNVSLRAFLRPVPSSLHLVRSGKRHLVPHPSLVSAYLNWSMHSCGPNRKLHFCLFYCVSSKKLQLFFPPTGAFHEFGSSPSMLLNHSTSL